MYLDYPQKAEPPRCLALHVSVRVLHSSSVRVCASHVTVMYCPVLLTFSPLFAPQVLQKLSSVLVVNCTNFFNPPGCGACAYGVASK